MTTVAISSDDPRSIKALEIAAGASQWLKVRTIDGEVAFGVPSQCERQAGRYYIVNAERCDCEDFKRHGLSHARLGLDGMHGPCKHVRAVQLYYELVKAQQARPARRRRRGHLAVVPPVTVDGADIFKRFEGE